MYIFCTLFFIVEFAASRPYFGELVLFLLHEWKWMIKKNNGTIF